MQHDCERCGTLGEHDMDWGYKAVLTAITVALVLLVAQALGRRLVGLFAALPIISGAALLHQHLTASHQDIQRFLRGYVAGLFGNALFALAFAATAVQLGPTAALAGALAFGLAATVGLVRTLDWMELRPLPARPSAR